MENNMQFKAEVQQLLQLMIHANAVIGNGERIRFFVGINPDLPFLGEFRLAE